MNIYETYAQEYYEYGLMPVPIKRGEKGPTFKGWTKVFSYSYPSQDTIDEWVKKYGSEGIGLATGKNSGVIAVDFDYTGENAERLEQQILGALPQTPIAKKGKKGWTRFYKYNSSIKNTGIDRGGVRFIDILSCGKQTVLPPTIHPDTNEPYKWITKHTLTSFELDDLPELNLGHIKQLRNIAETESETFAAFQTDDKSRHDKIFGFVMSQSEKSTSIDELIKKTIEFDLTVNGEDPKGPYFEDAKYKKGLPPHDACKKLVTRMCEWKKRNLFDKGVEWDIGKSSSYFGKKGKLSTRYVDFKEWLDFNYEHIRKDKITRIAYTRKSEKHRWKPIENLQSVLESEASQVGLSPSYVKRHLAKYINDLKDELLIDIPRWNKKDHIGEMFKRVHFTNVSNEHGTELMKEWMANIFARLKNPMDQNHFVIFKGRQGLGKDRFIHHLLCAFKEYFSEIEVNEKKSENYQVISDLLVALIPEFDETKKVNISVLKNMVTSSGARFRAPYMPKADYVPFHVSFISSCNFDYILRDTSGNRRYMIFEIDHIDWTYDDINSSQIIAQAISLFKEKYKASDEARQTMNAYIKDNTPMDEELLFVEDAKKIIQTHAEILGKTPNSSRKVRWPDINGALFNAAKMYGYKTRRIQSILKKHGLSKVDETSTHYVV